MMATAQEWYALAQEFGRLNSKSVSALTARNHAPKLTKIATLPLSVEPETYEWWTIVGTDAIVTKAFVVLAAAAGAALGAKEFASQCWLDFLCESDITSLRFQGAYARLDEDVREPGLQLTRTGRGVSVTPAADHAQRRPQG